MALMIAFQNISNLAELSDYTVEVYVNDKKIAGPFIVGKHRRSDGWMRLLKKFDNKKKWADYKLSPR